MIKIVTLFYFQIVIRCTFRFIGVVGNGMDPIMSFSAGETHLTLLVGVQGDTTNRVKRVDMYNTSSNSTITLTSRYSGRGTEIRERKGYNNLSSNTYILHSPTQLTILSNNFTRIDYALPNATVTIGNFGPNTQSFYVTQQNSANGCVVSNLSIGANATLAPMFTAGRPCSDLVYESGIPYVMYLSTVAVYINTISTTNTSTNELFIPIPSPYPNNSKIKTFYPYSAMMAGPLVFVHDLQLHTNPCIFNFTPVEPYDVALNNRWVFVSIGAEVRQYQIATCRLFSVQPAPGPVRIQTQELLVNRVYFLEPYSPYVLTY